jgi:aminopeptidase N
VVLVYRETFSLYFPGESKTLQKQDVARFMGHELAHCWMGNPTSIAWWDYLWLSEVFAMYYEYYMPTLVLLV